MEIFFTVFGLVIGFVWGLVCGFAIEFKARKQLYKRIDELESEDTE